MGQLETPEKISPERPLGKHDMQPDEKPAEWLRRIGCPDNGPRQKNLT